jgi:transposase
MKSGTYYVPAKHPQESVNQTGYIVIVLGIANPLQILKPALKGHVVPKPSVMTSEVEEFIRQCFEEDEEALRKQTHTEKRIYDRLVEGKGFTGGESTVMHYVRKIRSKPADAFVPLEYDPEEAMQVDWGEATVVMGDKKATVHIFCARLCFSAMPFVIAFPYERLQALLEGHIEAFKFFNGVPQRAIYDNMRTIVKDGWGKHVASEQKDFVQLKAHYAFKSTFCNPGQANEKGLVENLVSWARQNMFVPMPKVNSFEELNELLRKRCLSYRNHIIRGRKRSVGEEYRIEQSRLIPLPKRHMEPIRQVLAKVNHFSVVRFERNRYSVPVDYVGSDVTVKASVFEVSIWYRGQRIASHLRSYDENAVSYRLEHYLPLLEKKPRAVWNAQPVRHAKLPTEFWDFARKLPNDYEVVKLLRLMSQHGISAVLPAIQKSYDSGAYSYEGVLKHLETREGSQLTELPCDPVEIQQVDLRAYDNMVWGGESA